MDVYAQYYFINHNTFDVEQGGINSGPGSRRVPKRVWTDGPGFSLCAAPLESSGPGFRSVVRGRVNEWRSGGVLDRRCEGVQMPVAKRFLHPCLCNRSIEPGTGVCICVACLSWSQGSRIFHILVPHQ